MLSGAFFDTGMLAHASIRGAATFAEWLLVVLGMAIVAVTALDVTPPQGARTSSYSAVALWPAASKATPGGRPSRSGSPQS
jgi:hypothetical protein